MDRLANQPPQSDTREQKFTRAEKKFTDEVAAVQFIKDFWMAVDPENVGERIVDWDATQLREYTSRIGDKTTLQNLTVEIYNYKGGDFALSDKAVDFLKSRGII